MKHIPVRLLATASGLLWFVGCSSIPVATSVQPVGPSPTASPAAIRDGWLRVYSAREPAELDPNLAERLWDENLGRSDLLYDSAHTDYSIFNPNGTLVERVRNAHGLTDTDPVLVELPPGQYTIAAQAEEDSGEVVGVTIPVVIERGKRTTVHLTGDWRPSGRFVSSEIVKLPDGQIAGWRAEVAQQSR